MRRSSEDFRAGTGQVNFGFEDEQQKFHSRNEKFILEFEELYLVMKKVFERPIPRDPEVSALVYALGAMAVDDFIGIYLLAANGCGREANKLLRGLYERTVTMTYLSKFPKSSKDFIDYLDYERSNLAEELKKTNIFDDGTYGELLAEIKSDYDAYNHTHPKEEKCECCGVRKRMPSWTKMGMAEMARKAGERLDDPLVYLTSYLFPTKAFHVTPFAVSGFLKFDAEDNLSLRWESNPAEADRALKQAHWLLVTVLEVQNKFFQLGLDELANVKLEGIEASKTEEFDGFELTATATYETVEEADEVEVAEPADWEVIGGRR